MSRDPRSLAALLLLLTATPAVTQGIAIQHDPVGCVVAERFPQLEARLAPVDRVGRARLYFRPERSPYWYSVAMKREGDVFRAVMPKPRRGLEGFSYYIEATDVDFNASRTQEYAPGVEASPAGCEQKLLAAAVSTASVVVEAPAGAPAVPVGFSASGVVTAGTAATAAGAAGSGTGVSVGLVAGVVGGAAAVAVAVGKRGGSTSSPPPSSPPGPSTGPTPSPTPQPTDLTGRWVGTFPDGAVSTAGSCAGEQQDQLVVVTQSGSSLTGTYDGTIRVAGPPGCVPVGTHEIGTLAGTVGAGTVSFTVTITQPPGIKPAAVTGTFTANRMSGTFETIGGNGAGTWSVNRQ